jgi:hypothetical protein
METVMTSRLILVGVLSLALSGCALYRPSAGNPDGDVYVGSRASTYEASVNPPKIIGQVSYNPSAPLPETTQPATASGSAMPAPRSNPAP